MRLIDADSMKADLLTVDPQYEGMIQWCLTVLDAQPTIEERKKGKWELIIDADEYGEPYPCGCYCSECGFQSVVEDNYCPMCGAQMRETP